MEIYAPKRLHRKRILLFLPSKEFSFFNPSANPFMYNPPIPFLWKNINFNKKPAAKNGKFQIRWSKGIFFPITKILFAAASFVLNLLYLEPEDALP